MKAKYDFSEGKRGAVLPQMGNKVRITIRPDRDIVDWFRSKVKEQGWGNYQSMLTDALRKRIEHQDQSLEEGSPACCSGGVARLSISNGWGKPLRLSAFRRYIEKIDISHFF